MGREYAFIRRFGFFASRANSSRLLVADEGLRSVWDSRTAPVRRCARAKASFRLIADGRIEVAERQLVPRADVRRIKRCLEGSLFSELPKSPL